MLMDASLEDCLGFGRWSYSMTTFSTILCGSPIENVNYIFVYCDQFYVICRHSK